MPQVLAAILNRQDESEAKLNNYLCRQVRKAMPDKLMAKDGYSFSVSPKSGYRYKNQGIYKRPVTIKFGTIGVKIPKESTPSGKGGILPQRATERNTVGILSKFNPGHSPVTLIVIGKQGHALLRREHHVFEGDLGQQQVDQQDHYRNCRKNDIGLFHVLFEEFFQVDLVGDCIQGVNLRLFFTEQFRNNGIYGADKEEMMLATGCRLLERRINGPL